MAYPAPEECIAKGIICASLPSLEAFTDAAGKPRLITSTVEKIGGLAWRMKLRKMLKPTRLILYVYCNEEVNDYLWLCKAHFTAQSWHLDGLDKDKPFHTYAYGHFFCFNTYYWTFSANNVRKQLEKGPIELKLEIKICQVLEKSLPPLETSLVVNMGEGHSETLLVNKHTLASFSSYFRNLFFEDWRDKKEQGGNFFELNESEHFDIKAFKWMIYGVMSMGWMLHESNMLIDHQSVRIIKLGVRFDVALMVDYCEKSLINPKSFICSKMELLELADQYSLVQLKEHCLNEMSMLDYMEQFSKNHEIHLRLSKVTQEQVQSKLDGKAKELRKSTLELEVPVRANRHNRALVNPFNMLAKTVLGQKARPI